MSRNFFHIWQYISIFSIFPKYSKKFRCNCRGQGFAAKDEKTGRIAQCSVKENEYGICCIGSIVMGQTGKPVGAISLSGNAFSGEDKIRFLADILLPPPSGCPA